MISYHSMIIMGWILILCRLCSRMGWIWRIKMLMEIKLTSIIKDNYLVLRLRCGNYECIVLLVILILLITLITLLIHNINIINTHLLITNLTFNITTLITISFFTYLTNSIFQKLNMNSLNFFTFITSQRVIIFIFQ